MTAAETQPRPDPRRWFTLAIVISAVLIVALDTTILNVAIPTILRDLDTTLPSLQWVITGYSLTFASLLIIGGRLGDPFGPRRMFIVGAAVFGLGSLLASVATSVPTLVFGEAVIEGIGASLMMPATLGILSSTFHGRERATAFGMWGATAGAAVAFGPLVGGYLTTNYSWRWSFRINVIVAPLAILGALLFMRRQAARTGRRERIDVPGALLVASGTFLLVFALSEGETYGWWHPVKSFMLGGADVWPADRSVSIVPFAFAGAVVLLCAFYVLERWKERSARDPLFEFGLLRRRSFRYGLLTTMVLAMGQLGFLFVVPVFLQDGEHLSAVENGLWLLPSGISIIAGTQLGARLTHRIGTTAVVRVGLVLEAIGLLVIALAVSPDLTFLGLLPGLVLFGVGIGFASSQLTNVVLSDIPDERSGAASGANTTVRQLGAALGIAVIGAILTSQTISSGTDAIRSSGLPASLKARTIAGVRVGGVNFRLPSHTRPADLATLRDVFDSAVAHGTRAALFYAVAVVVIGAITSFLIPRITIRGAAPSVESTEETVDSLEALAPLTSAVVDANTLDREIADQTREDSEPGGTPNSVSTTR